MAKRSGVNYAPSLRGVNIPVAATQSGPGYAAGGTNDQLTSQGTYPALCRSSGHSQYAQPVQQIPCHQLNLDLLKVRKEARRLRREAAPAPLER
jgi:hypothetical protein